MAATFGIDFGTTNSVVTLIGPDPETGKTGARVLSQDGRPHPTVVWYGSGEPVVGRRAKDQLSELGLGVFGNVVRSPKMYLGSPVGMDVGGVTRQAVDVVADVLRFLREDARGRGFKGNPFSNAVITIPVTMRGGARADLRQAALKAGIHVYQFVHEPLAALYGYLRSRPSFRQELANLERRLVAVFDWGGGTLDLTLCQMQGGVLSQIFNTGDYEVGGDSFDIRLRNLVRQKHETLYPHIDWSRLQPSAEARLIQACEDAKIALSTRDTTAIYVRDVLAVPGREKDIRIELSRRELEEAVHDLVLKGLRRIDTLLDLAGIPRTAVEFCLATGGMVGMPAIQAGLRELFGMNRLRLLPNSASLISEGAAWIAHDKIDLELAKPIELLHAGDSYVPLIAAGTVLPVDGNAIKNRYSMYCVDPSDGFAKFMFARPNWPHRHAPADARSPYAHLTLEVDRNSRPLLERLEIDLAINHDLIVEISAFSSMRGTRQSVRIDDLEFGLGIARVANGDSHN